jgi:hypothetical protein
MLDGLCKVAGASALAGCFAACAPAYRPPTPFVPLLAEEGDTHLAVHLGTGGGQLDVAQAVAPGFALRAGAQVAGYASDGAYTVGTVGAGLFGGSPELLWGVTLVGGGGYSRGISTLRVTSTTADGEETTSETVWRNSGMLGTGALRAELGRRIGDNAAVGANIGPTWHILSHDALSDGTGTGQMLLVEAASVARAGSPVVMFEGSVGFAYPLWVSAREEDDTSEVGIPVPIVLGIGLTFDL